MDIIRKFEDRLEEIEEYFKLLDAIEQDIQSGVPSIGAQKYIISVPQQKFYILLFIFNCIILSNPLLRLA